MKKFAIAMMAVLAMFAGAACSGGTSSSTVKNGQSSSTTTGWSEANKTSLRLKLVMLSGKEHSLTNSQQECMFNWVISHYKSMEEMEADKSDSSLESLDNACK